MSVETIPTEPRSGRADALMAGVVVVLGLGFPIIGFASGMLTSGSDMMAFTLCAIWAGTLDRTGAAVIWVWRHGHRSIYLSVHPLCGAQAIASIGLLLVAPIGTVAFASGAVLIGVGSFVVAMGSFMCIIFVETVNDTVQGTLPIDK